MKDRRPLEVDVIVLAIALIVIDLIVVTLALAAEATGMPWIVIIVNFVVLVVLYFLHASGRIKFTTD